MRNVLNWTVVCAAKCFRSSGIFNYFINKVKTCFFIMLHWIPSAKDLNLSLILTEFHLFHHHEHTNVFWKHFINGVFWLSYYILCFVVRTVWGTSCSSLLCFQNVQNSCRYPDESVKVGPHHVLHSLYCLPVSSRIELGLSCFAVSVCDCSGFPSLIIWPGCH